MSKRYELWDKTSDVYTPSGKKYTASEWIQKYSWIENESAKPVVAAGVMNGRLISELNSMKVNCEAQGATFEEGLSDQQLLDAIEAWEDEQAAKAEEAASEPTADERIAAALEYQNLLTL